MPSSAHAFLGRSTNSTVLVAQGEFVKEYDIEYGPCTKGGPHSWTAEYTMPEDSPQRVAEYVRTSSYCSPVP